MAKLLKLRRGSTSQHSSFTGAEGEVTIDTTKDTAVVHDGSQAGGRPLAREDMSNVSSASIAGQLGTDSIATSKIAGGALPTDVTIANANVTSNAAIAGTKISPDFGSQNMSTTGTLGCGAITSTGNLTVSSTGPQVLFTDTNNNPDYGIWNNDGTLRFIDSSSNATRFEIQSAGLTKANNNFQVVGNITVSGTVDGRDVATDGSKLDGIESGATADQTAAEIRTLVESASDSNVFTDADHSKLNGIEASATADQTDAEIRAAVEAASDSNVFTDADHSKLNGIEASATADQTAAEIRTLVESASDSNVFTDADHSKLNGIEASATADQTASEIISLVHNGSLTPNDVTAGYIYGTNKIGRDSSDYITWTNNDRMDVYVNGSNEFRFDSGGDFHADGNVTAYSTTVSSDRKLKDNIKKIPNALEKVEALNGVSFDWKKTGERSAGVIAQEVQGVLPEAVKEVTPLGGGDSHLAVNYHALTSILIEAIKELKAELDEHKGGS